MERFIRGLSVWGGGGGYFLCHIGLRLLAGGALGLDEAEILLDARYLAWGYGPQFPLYAWLQ